MTQNCRAPVMVRRQPDTFCFSLAQPPDRSPEPTQPDQPRPDPQPRHLGDRLTRRPGARHPLQTPGTSAKLASAGRATTLPDRNGPAHCRTDGLVGALPAQDPPVFSALLAGKTGESRKQLGGTVRLDDAV